MRIFGGKRKYVLFLVVALFLGLQLSPIGVVHATETDAPPHVDSIDPYFRSAGDEVTLTGTDFGSSQGSSTVTFGALVPLPATSIISWSDTQIQCVVPEGIGGEMPVVVATSGGESNGVSFEIEDNVPTYYPIEIESLTPSEAMQFTPATLSIRLSNASPPDGYSTSVWLRDDEGREFLSALGITDGSDVLTFNTFFYVPPGAYGVHVYIYYYSEGSKESCFAVTSNPYCGTGSGSAVLMLGMTLGLLSLAGSGGILAKRRRK